MAGDAEIVNAPDEEDHLPAFSFWGRRMFAVCVYVIFMTKWGKLAPSGYWLDPKQGFDKAYVTDATMDTLELVTEDLEELPAIDAELDDVLNRHNIELDMEVWGKLLEE